MTMPTVPSHARPARQSLPAWLPSARRHGRHEGLGDERIAAGGSTHEPGDGQEQRAPAEEALHHQFLVHGVVMRVAAQHSQPGHGSRRMSCHDAAQASADGVARRLGREDPERRGTRDGRDDHQRP
jgi:hypothetical protein